MAAEQLKDTSLYTIARYVERDIFSLVRLSELGGRKDGWTDGWMDGWMDGWRDG